MLTFQEKSLYHQIHPAKLLTDWSTGLVALYPFWQHNLGGALLIAFAPSILVSMLILGFVSLEKYKRSPLGNYMRRYMTRPVEVLRFLGYAVMVLGAWYHVSWLIPVGLMVILLAWFRGVILPGRKSS